MQIFVLRTLIKCIYEDEVAMKIVINDGQMTSLLIQVIFTNNQFSSGAMSMECVWLHISQFEYDSFIKIAFYLLCFF